MGIVTALCGLLVQDCLLCGQESGSEILCRACAGDLPRLPSPHCPVCALPTPAGECCGRCLGHPPHYDRTLAVFSYGFPLDRLIQSFKYGHRLALAAFLGGELAALAKDAAVDRVMPLPLHPARLRERGFNQALELARPVARALGKPLDARTCLRIRQTPVQAGLPWKERKQNMRGAFGCSRDLSGQRILLVDDVMTTGASLDECARTLKKHGAAEVTLLVAARTLP
jgi:ComF family protein